MLLALMWSCPRFRAPWQKHKPTENKAAIWVISLATGVGPSPGEPQLPSLPFNLLAREWARSALAHLTQERWRGLGGRWQQLPRAGRTEEVEW